MRKLYFLAGLFLMTTAVFAQNKNVTIKVDMKNETVGGSVYVAGSFNNWSATANAMTQVGTTTIYEATIAMADGHYEFKFVNGTSWENVPVECAVDGGYGADGGNKNRWLEVWSDTTLPAVLFNNCAPDGQVSIQFLVDMIKEPTIADTVSIAGSFQGWSAGTNIMADVAGDSVYRYMHYMKSGDTVQYKFVNGSSWESVPATCAVSGNRQLIPTANMNEGRYCFNLCTACPVKPLPQYDLTIMVDMQQVLACDTLDYVDIAGPINSWNGGDTLLPIGNKIYARTFTLDSGNFEFKFRYSAMGSTTWENSANRNFMLSMDDTIRSCFATVGETSFCPPVTIPAEADITFRVDMATWGGTIDTGGVHLIGDFTSWQDNPIKMAPIGGGIYEVVVPDFCPETMAYKFVNGVPDANSKAGEEGAGLDSTCAIDDGFGGWNRSFIRPDGNPHTLAYIFDSCSKMIGQEENFTDQNIVLSPNPFHDNAVVRLDEALYTISIYDMTGRMVQVMDNATGHVMIERGHMNSGVYIMTITNENGAVNSSKIVVE